MSETVQNQNRQWTQRLEQDLARAHAHDLDSPRVRANRANAQCSTGPRTAQGKRHSSQNALKHGVLAKAAVNPSAEGPARYQEFHMMLERYAIWLMPDGAVECDLVETIALCQWRKARLLAYEQHKALERFQREGKAAGEPYPTIPAEADARLILRYQAQLDRELYRAKAELRAHQRQMLELRRALHANTGQDLRDELEQMEEELDADPPSAPAPASLEKASEGEQRASRAAATVTDNYQTKPIPDGDAGSARAKSDRNTDKKRTEGEAGRSRPPG